MEYAVTNGVNVYPIMELEIEYTGTELDVCQFTCAGKYVDNTWITIYNPGVAVQFLGYVKEVEELEPGVIYRHTCYERAVELKTMPLIDGGLDIFSKSSNTISQLAAVAVSGSGWTIDPSSTDATVIASMSFYLVNRLQALNKILREMRGYFVLFNSTTSVVKYLNSTTANTDRTATPIIPRSTLSNSKSMLRGITQVTVIGKETSIRANAGTSTTSRIYYQVDDIGTVGEAQVIADAILADVGVLYGDVIITLSPEEIQYDVRDKVTLTGSATQYYIKKIVQGMDEITLTLDTGKVSTVESLGSRIHLVEGNFPAGTDATWNGDWQNVSGDGSTATEWTFDIKDIAVISDPVNLTFNIDKYRKYVTASTTTDNLSDVTPLLSSISAAPVENISASGLNYYPYNGATRYVTTTGMTSGYQNALFTFSCTAMYNGDLTSQYITLQPQYSWDNSTWYNITSGANAYTITTYLPKRSMVSTATSTTVINSVSVSRDATGRYVASSSGGSPTTYEAGIVNDVGYSSISIPDYTAYPIYVPISFTCFIPGHATNATLYTRVAITNYTNTTVTIINCVGILQAIQRHLHSVPAQTNETADIDTAPAGFYLYIVNSGGSYSLGNLANASVTNIKSYLATGVNRLRAVASSTKGSAKMSATYQTLGKS